jgi:hypothetical protein
MLEYSWCSKGQHGSGGFLSNYNTQTRIKCVGRRNMRETDHLGELDAGAMIILKRIFKKSVGDMNWIDLGRGFP